MCLRPRTGPEELEPWKEVLRTWVPRPDLMTSSTSGSFAVSRKCPVSKVLSNWSNMVLRNWGPVGVDYSVDGRKGKGPQDGRGRGLPEVGVTGCVRYCSLK